MQYMIKRPSLFGSIEEEKEYQVNRRDQTITKIRVKKFSQVKERYANTYTESTQNLSCAIPKKKYMKTFHTVSCRWYMASH